jgi:hypothetical protein
MEWQIIRTVTEADARRVYDKQAQARKPEDELRVRHILVTSESEATELSARVSRRNFAALAQQLSKDRANSWNGGDLGYITKGQMDEDFEATAFSLKPGAISEPVRTRFGWHIILVEDRRAREVPSFESIKDDIVRLLIQRKVQEAVSTLRTDAQIEITDPDLSRAVVQAKAPPTTPDQAVGSVASAAPEGPSAVYAFTKGVEYSVASEHLNLRRGPNPEADVLAKLESGTTGVFWLGDAKDHEDERWVKVKVGEQIGWVNDRFIRPVVAPNLDIDQKPDQEFDGESYRAPTVAAYEVCRHACLLDERCKAMEFNRKEKVCYLFDTVPKIGRSSRADAGIKRAASR